MPAQVEELHPTEYATGAQESTRSAYHGDTFFFRMVAAFLGSVAVLALISIAVLAGIDVVKGSAAHQIPESITALGSAAVGALAGLFTGTQASK